MWFDKVASTPNDALQRTWPEFSSRLAAPTAGGGFGKVVLLRQAGHAAERECYADNR
jgi:hypothetical protein